MSSVPCRLLPLLILLLCPAWVLADARPNPLDHGMNPQLRHGEVRMLEETVLITLGRERCRIQCLFVLVNTSDTVQQLEVGFPSNYPHDILDAVLRVDDRPTPLRTAVDKKVNRRTHGEDVFERVHMTHWLLWNMRFEPHQTRIVEITYEVAPRDNADIWSTPYTQHRFDIAREFEAGGPNVTPDVTPEVAAVLAAIRSLSTGYTLRTGAGWKDTIASAVLQVEHPELGAQALRWAEPETGLRFTARGLEWRLTNLEPDFDLFVEFNPSLPLDAEQELAARAVQRHPDSAALRAYADYLAGLAAQSGGLGARSP